MTHSHAGGGLGGWDRVVLGVGYGVDTGEVGGLQVVIR